MIQKFHLVIIVLASFLFVNCDDIQVQDRKKEENSKEQTDNSNSSSGSENASGEKVSSETDSSDNSVPEETSEQFEGESGDFNYDSQITTIDHIELIEDIYFFCKGNDLSDLGRRMKDIYTVYDNEILPELELESYRNAANSWNKVEGSVTKTLEFYKSVEEKPQELLQKWTKWLEHRKKMESLVIEWQKS